MGVIVVVQHEKLENRVVLEMLFWAAAAASSDMPVTVLNLQGQVLHAAVLAKGQDFLDLDLSGLPAGVYLVRVALPEGRVHTQKLVKE
jgi:hypothetical protein